MKNKQLLLILFIFLWSVLSNFCFAQNTDLITYSPHCILMEASTGHILYEKNAYDTAYPASTTKIMTAILALELCHLKDTTTVSNNAISNIPAGYTTSYLVEGEVLTIEQLLYLLLIPSANDAAVVLAEHIAGSVDTFSYFMNEKAKELGCKNTHFVNPNGIQSEKHYSTAYDLALMGQYAMKNETFRKIVSTVEYTLPATNKYPNADRSFKNTNALIRSDLQNTPNDHYLSYATGIKTGYTNAAKDCIVASAKKDNIEYIVVILGGDELENDLSARYLDCQNLFSYAFNHHFCTILEKNSVVKQISIQNANSISQNLDVIAQDSITTLLKKDVDITTLTPTIEIFPDLHAPILKDTIIGTIRYDIEGTSYSCNLLAGSDILESNLLTNILTIASILLVCFLLYHLLNSDTMKRKK